MAAQFKEVSVPKLHPDAALSKIKRANLHNHSRAGKVDG